MEESPQWLNMIPKDREWHARESKRRHGVSEDKKLELRLGPPGEDRSLLSLSYLPSMASITHLHTNSHGAKRGFQDTLEAKPWLVSLCPHLLPLLRSRITSQSPHTSVPRGTPDLGGWVASNPFIQENLVNSSSSKPESESPNKIPEETGYGKYESSKTGLFVKINMDGVPIGRKVDLKAVTAMKNSHML
ncbi:Auxin-responsive protein IAA26 [Vitis vinifera]|uniref:Auxin-responsive protein n=1 Tax=Vitis vinifera TaxID=29760 RepID=A0A438CC68_VITVI|nr:Auxin-responsive protein IAA26 [Vitis vinifera]